MRYRRQTAFLKPPERRHGGDVTAGRRKTARPVVTKRPMHLTLRAEKARGRMSLLRYRPFVSNLIAKLSKQWQVKVFEQSNVGNHLHLLVQARDRRGFQNFLRVLAGQIAQRIGGEGKFWDQLAFSRIVEWGKDFKNVVLYVFKNTLEVEGFLPPRTKTKMDLLKR